MDEPVITLAQFLKWQQLAQTGGEAKMLIQSGEVFVNGDLELRRGRKLVTGDRVSVGNFTRTVALAGEIPKAES
jgi:ribosome-associated protein